MSNKKMNVIVKVYAYDDDTHDLYVNDEYIETFDFYDEKMKQLDLMNNILNKDFSIEQMQDYLIQKYSD